MPSRHARCSSRQVVNSGATNSGGWRSTASLTTDPLRLLYKWSTKLGTESSRSWSVRGVWAVKSAPPDIYSYARRRAYTRRLCSAPVVFVQDERRSSTRHWSRDHRLGNRSAVEADDFSVALGRGNGAHDT